MSERAVSLLEQILAEQKKQTSLLEQIATQNLALIEALADEGGVDPDASPQTYLSGAPCR
ncbi:hypothetical protein [Pseudomonas sp. Teo4]|uniref:hypothetical protein n=1 Tax=Pseudomonas sp. Teo4 TaxID=3064528 RepID=UPI002ABCD9B7|nr:hypothetical protein [Pseudomonas sp. Teo4]MDZ3990363.1 hypothetical protein [Pseudomonas sp. Teo4]